MHFVIALMYCFSTVWSFLKLSNCSVSLVILRPHRNCLIEKRRFCYSFLHACLMLNFISGCPVWKHISLRGLVSTDQENKPLHVQQENVTSHMFYLHKIIITKNVVI
jgi:ABC-type microcin C transport system permease subunit YejB